MLNKLRIYTTDNIWRKIVLDFGADISEDKITADIDLDELHLLNISPMELKSEILHHINNEQNKILNDLFGRHIVLPGMQMKIIMLLKKSGGMSINDLKIALGYFPGATTNAIDTAIYQMRKTFGLGIIKNQNGRYFLGEL